MNETRIRNPFVALCENASQNNWCWNIYCTTCGHGAFKVAFSKLIQDQHPDGDSFWPHGRSNSDLLKEVDKYNDFWRRVPSIANQLKLTTILSEAKISDIQAIAKFPDWLGYIGLVINHCPNLEARKILSDALIPQFIVMTKERRELSDYFKNMLIAESILTINDLSKIESGNIH